MVSKALPLWRRSICHHKMFNTRWAIKKIMSRLVCLYVRVFVRICVWVAGNEVCASLFSMCTFSKNGFLVLLVTLKFLVLLLVSVWFQRSTNLSVFPASAEQTCRQDKMRHFVCGKHDMFTLAKVRSQCLWEVHECFASRIPTTMLCPSSRTIKNDYDTS